MEYKANFRFNYNTIKYTDLLNQYGLPDYNTDYLNKCIFIRVHFDIGELVIENTFTDINTRRLDLIYDIKDINGNMLLPFTKYQPLIIYDKPYYNISDYFDAFNVDINKVYSFKGLNCPVIILHLIKQSNIYYYIRDYVIEYTSRGIKITRIYQRNKKKITNIRNRLNILENELSKIFI